MKILLDTNVVLDVFLKRKEFYRDGTLIFASIEKGVFEGFLCPTTVTTIYYVMRRNFSENECLVNLKGLLKLFEITKVDKNILLQSIEKSSGDFEDSVIYTSADNVDIIITRDKKGFRKCTKKVLSPYEFLNDYL